MVVCQRSGPVRPRPLLAECERASKGSGTRDRDPCLRYHALDPGTSCTSTSSTEVQMPMVVGTCILVPKVVQLYTVLVDVPLAGTTLRPYVLIDLKDKVVQYALYCEWYKY